MPEVPWLEKWLDFANIVSCDQRTFNALADQAASQHAGGIPYEFNPLRRRPVIQLDNARYVAVDPWLLVDRMSWGVFYDIFERYQSMGKIADFTIPFGNAFERFADRLLRSAAPTGTVWSEAESQISKGSGKKNPTSHRIADLAYLSPTNPVLIECAIVRPTRDFGVTATGSQLEKVAEQVADELDQIFQHIAAIQEGAWKSECLHPGDWVGLLLTFGRVATINSVFFRNKITRFLREMGHETSAYVVLSVDEFDAVISLAERGHDFGKIVAELASESSFDPLQKYDDLLSINAISSFAKVRAERMYDFLPRLAGEVADSNA
jgi:hypothetical protein